MAVRPQEQRSVRTIKISRLVHTHLQEKATLVEPFDRTIRRELGLAIQPGTFPKKAPAAPAPKRKKAPSEWTTGKISEDTWNYITSKAEWNESVDHTLRRLLKLDQPPVEERKKRTKSVNG
jgi:hypothetical protein